MVHDPLSDTLPTWLKAIIAIANEVSVEVMTADHCQTPHCLGIAVEGTIITDIENYKISRQLLNSAAAISDSIPTYL